NIHVSFLRTVPPYSHQADVWVEILKYFNYKKVIFIHSSDTDGRALLGRFQTTSQSLEDDIDIKVQVEAVIEFETGLSSFKDKLIEMKNAQARVYLMYASKLDARIIFRDAAMLNMTDAGYAWVVTEQALEADNVPEGILGLQLVNATNEKAHIRDSMYSYLPKDSKSTVLATRTPGPSLAYTLGVARRHKQLLAGNHTQQTCRPRVPDQQSRRKFAQVRKSAGFATELAAQTPAKAQIYPGHSKAKEPVADQPLPQADVPPASQRTSTELTSQEGDEQVRVAGNCCSSRPEFAVTVRRSYVSWGTAVVFGQSSPRPYAAPLPFSAFINVYSSRGIAVVPGQNSP
ncbi:hypothetical protein NQ315_017137, partial [Exocentrus adspersus]